MKYNPVLALYIVEDNKDITGELVFHPIFLLELLRRRLPF